MSWFLPHVHSKSSCKAIFLNFLVTSIINCYYTSICFPVLRSFLFNLQSLGHIRIDILSSVIRHFSDVYYADSILFELNSTCIKCQRSITLGLKSSTYYQASLEFPNLYFKLLDLDWWELRDLTKNNSSEKYNIFCFFSRIFVIYVHC